MIDVNRNMGSIPVRRVITEQSFTQLDMGKKTSFSGAIKIGGVTFKYRLSILRLMDWQNSDDLNRILKLLFDSEKEIENVRKNYFAISMKRRGKEMKLSAREYAFFASVIIPYAFGFFRREETKVLGKIKAEASKKGVSYHGGGELTSTSYLTITEEEVKRLQSSKFGCRFN